MSGERAERQVEVRRVFDAPRELVWRAWTDPDQLSRWWGPQGFSTPRETVELDLRPGGVFAATMVSDSDGTEYPSSGVFVEVEEPERLVFEEEDVDHPDIDRTRAEITFNDLGDGRTELVCRQTIVTTEDFVEMSRRGWESSLEKLAELLG